MVSSRSPSIVVIGSSNTDLILPCTTLPKPGETIKASALQRSAGGKGANQAVAAARAGARVSFVGACGDDDFGTTAKALLKRDGIDISHFKTLKNVTSGVALIFLDPRQNLIAVAESANDLLSSQDVRRASSMIRNASAVICQLEIPIAAVITAAHLAHRANVSFILNPAPAQKLPGKLLQNIHTLIPNEHEAFILTGLKNPEAAAKRLRSQGCHHVVITLGSKGALLVDEKGVRRFPARKVHSVDTVGAGDCFTAWVSVGIAEGLSMDVAVQRAILAASIAVTRSGAQSAMPYRREINDIRPCGGLL